MFDVRSIGKLRKQIGFTQKQLAKLAGVSQSLIAKIESGKIDPAYSKVVQILSALEIEQKRDKKSTEQIMSSPIIFVHPSDKLTRVITLMRSRNISQLPVLDHGKCVGSMIDSIIVSILSDSKINLQEAHVSDVMGDCFPSVPSSSSSDVVIELLKHYSAVLVEKNGIIKGIITKADLFKTI
ncbi:Inosine-5'-monophosphate dehydrogenase [Candidatus Bilamarchaeum dharawalense]|uniref:Inosine-5'-monophosphate dehydrogenase n=1 Tax=Candidatus Bilamarchaeum dharawalense TaxID=2885759 RepID=A0A5E4LMW9_9ARCH|nr:Inosine-5'-monophosphate dehydrogenase [Candidatus Bilamarchaeum dharawalense]